MAKDGASKARKPGKAPAIATQIDQTPVAPQPQAGTSQNPPPIPSIPLDTVMKLLQALNPNLNLEATLAQLINSNQPSLTPQPTTEPTPSKPDITGKPSGIVESETGIKGKEEGSEVRVGIEAQHEGEGEGEKVVEEEKVVEGEKNAESEVVVEEKELQAAREREIRTKYREEKKYVEGIVEDESREETEVIGSEENNEEGSVEGGEEQEAGDESVEGSEIFGTESGTEEIGEEDRTKMKWKTKLLIRVRRKRKSVRRS